MKKLLPLLLVLNVPGLNLAGQEPAKGKKDEQKDLVIRTRVNVVIAPTTVLTKDGGYVNGLEPRDFQLLDNGKPQDINEDVSFIPISLVVLVQSSAQTEKVLPSIQKMGSMLEGLVLGEQGEAAIVAFDHRIQKLTDFTNDGTKFRDGLAKLKPGSYTSRMTDAVIEAARMLKNRPANRRKVILLVSETKDGGSEGRVRDALLDIQFGNIIVYPVNMSRWLNKLNVPAQAPRPSPVPVAARPLPAGMPQTPNSAMQMGYGGTFGSVFPAIQEIFTAAKAIFVDNPQEVYSKYSGGTEQNFTGLKGLEEAIIKIGEELHSQYLLSYNPNTATEGGWHTIQVVVKKPGMEVRTRRGYWAAAQPN
jgi:VWFA-related protein